MNIKVIMHRDLSSDESDCDPDKVVGAYEEKHIKRTLERLEDECCEHDFYYVVDVEV